MSNEYVLYDERSQIAESEILRLEERRENIAEALEVFRLALEKLLGKPPLAGDCAKFFELTEVRQVEVEAKKMHLEREGVKVKINVFAAVDSIETTPAIQTLIEAWEIVNDLSPEDAMQYWSDAKQDFRPIKVKEAEIEGIRERCRRYIHPSKVDVYETLKGLVELINYANHHDPGCNVKPVEIRTDFPFIAPFIEEVLLSNKEYPRDFGGMPTHQYKVKENRFLVRGETFEAFDEK